MQRSVRTTRRAGVVFVAVASVLLGVGAMITTLEWGVRSSMPVLGMLLLMVLPAASLIATAVDGVVARSDR